MLFFERDLLKLLVRRYILSHSKLLISLNIADLSAKTHMLHTYLYFFLLIMSPKIKEYEMYEIPQRAQ